MRRHETSILVVFRGDVQIWSNSSGISTESINSTKLGEKKTADTAHKCSCFHLPPAWGHGPLGVNLKVHEPLDISCFCCWHSRCSFWTTRASKKKFGKCRPNLPMFTHVSRGHSCWVFDALGWFSWGVSLHVEKLCHQGPGRPGWFHKPSLPVETLIPLVGFEILHPTREHGQTICWFLLTNRFHNINLMKNRQVTDFGALLFNEESEHKHPDLLGDLNPYDISVKLEPNLSIASPNNP